MTYSPFKMKGHSLPGIKQKESPSKHYSLNWVGKNKHNNAHE